jgi:lipopolysaccharide assembly outer membrane protein LptD (OstA)
MGKSYLVGGILLIQPLSIVGRPILDSKQIPLGIEASFCLAQDAPMKYVSLCLLLFGFACHQVGAADVSEAPILSIHASGEEAELIDTETTSVIRHPKGVELTYGDTTLMARQISVNKETGDIEAEGTVRLQRGSQFWISEFLQYNYVTRAIKAQSFRTGTAPIYVSGFGLSTSPSNNLYWATNTFVTTDDVAEPVYRIKAREVTLKPGEWIKATGATLFLGKVPVLYLPHYKRTLQRDANNIMMIPGYNTRYGAYLLSQYNWSVSEHLGGAVHLDYRLKRGPGTGTDLNFDLGRWGKGEVQLYYTRDQDPERDLQDQPISEDRHRVSFSYQANLRTNFSAKISVREMGDPFITRDFFETEYRRDPQPDSFFELNQSWANWNLNALVRPQINDFLETVERLPDVKLSAFRQQVGRSPLYYEGENSVGYFQYRSAENSQRDFAAFRADTFHQMILPRNFFGWLNVSPRVGVRYTYYEEAHGPGATTSEENRGIFNTGMEVSTKASRSWKAVASKFWDVDQLRHIVEPSINYVFVPSPSVEPKDLPQFDREFPSLRLLPLQFPDYNSIDSIDSQNVIRFSIRNRLQTKRNGQIENLANWALYTDWRLDPRPDQDTFADLYSDLELKPRSWMSLISQVRYDIDNFRLSYSDHYVVLEPNDVWSYAIGHRYMRDDLGFGPDSGHNLALSRLYFRLNENWALRIAHLLDLKEGYLQEQYYSIYRDLRSWTSALTFRVRQDKSGKEDYTLALTFSLKVMPRYHLGVDKENPSMLLGR